MDNKTATEKSPRRLLRLLLVLLSLALMTLLVVVVRQEDAEPPVVESISRFILALPPEIRQRAEELLGHSGGEDAGALVASGIIQAEQVSVASEFGGRIADIPVAEGDRVAAGDLLVQLDTVLLDAQIEAAAALVAVAQAALAQAQAGVRPGQITVAEAQLAAAKAGRDAATQAVSDTLKLLANPQDILLQIAVAQAEAMAAQRRLDQATALKNAAEVVKNQFESLDAGPDGRHRSLISAGSVDELPGPIPPDLWEQLPGPVDGVHTVGDWELHIGGGSYRLYRLVDIPLDLHLTPNRWWQAWVGVNAAAVQLEGIQTSLYHLYDQREDQQAMKARVDEALSALAQSEAQIAAAHAQLDGMRAGATAEQVAALEARVAQALAAVEALEQKRAMMSLASPLDGTVLSTSAHPGEVTAAGAGMLSVADLAEMNLVVYVPENRIGQVYLNEEVQIQVDSFPGRVLEGYVSHISDRAEFTPRNVATREERVNLVFAVEIRIANLDGALKPGMPADVLFVGP